MMRWVVGSSLKFHRLIVAAAVGVIAFGIVQVGRTPVDALPEFSPPTVEVQTEALGLSAAEVEQLITVPLEQDLLVGVAFLDEIESVSLPGLSSVVMTFEPGTDLLDARQVVQERLTQAVGIAGLPAVAKLPQMIQPLSTNSRVSMVKLTSSELSAIEMSVLARWVISPRLLGVSGVANVAIWGNRERQLQVLVDPQRLQRKGITLSQIVRTAGNSLEVSPLSYLEASSPGTGGFIETGNQRLNVFHEQAISTPEELAQVPLEGTDGERVTVNGEPELLGDVTDVVENHQPLIGDTSCSAGSQCLLLVVEKFPGASTVDVSDGVDSAIAALRPGLADMTLDSSVYRPAAYVDSALDNLGWALLIGAALLMLLILAFFDWRRSVIAAATIVVSSATAVVMLDVLGATVDLMVVAGLVLGLTAIVDDAVNDVDAIIARLRARRDDGDARRLPTVIIEAATLARGPVLYAALIVAAAAIPLLFLRGEGGAFLPSIALSYLLAVGASMLSALVILPVMCMLLVGNAPARARESRVAGSLHARYDSMGPQLVARPVAAFAVIAALAAGGFIAAPFLESSLRPALQERAVLMNVEAAPGTSLLRMTELTTAAVADLEALPGIREANAHVGRAITSDQKVDVNQGQIWVSMDDAADYDKSVAAISGTLSSNPELTGEVLTYSDQRVRDVLREAEHDVVVRVYGEDAAVLDAKAEELRAAIEQLDGVSTVNVDAAPEEPTVEVRVDLAKAQQLGIKPGDVRRAASALLGGITVGHLFQNQKVFDVVVWGAPQVREDENDLRNLLIDTPDGRTIRLGDVAEVANVPNDTVIRHESVARFLELTADVSGRDVSDVTSDVEAAIAATAFPLDHHAEVIDLYAERQADTTRLIGVAVAVLIAIFLLLQAAFRSWRLAVLGLVTLPVAVTGGLFVALLDGGTVKLGTIAGILVGLGLAARGLVTFVRHCQHLQIHEGVAFDDALVVRATRDRLVPMLQSALATVALLAPIAVLGGRAGLEVLQPAVLAVMGVLVTSTLVNLVALPALYLRFGKDADFDNWVDELLEAVPDADPVSA
ncbi:MAG TPA: efflux RND transporter permease subunit [Nocardioidaceae bacterium]|nr:efflux RND transporter permease subunit [Nocardioidaceae bacterium]